MLRVVMAQINPLAGDIDGNADRVIEVIGEAVARHGAGLVVFPELVLIGYPPEDLLLRPSLPQRIERALQCILPATRGVTAVLGVPRRHEGKLRNSALVLRDGAVVAAYDKQILPNYQVFDEKRYFTPGGETCVVDVAGIRTAITVCEDIWEPEPAAAAARAGAQLVVNLSASPFHGGKQLERQQLLYSRARETGLPVLYVNQVGGQDELVFDGGSLAVNAEGEMCFQAPQFEEGLYCVEVEPDPSGPARVAAQAVVPALELVPSLYRALVTGVRDYVTKNRFPGVMLGLSGGIDSAVTLAIAADALGPERVEAVMMPFRYTSQMSRNDAAEQARRMGVHYRSIGIEPIFDAFMDALTPEFEGRDGPDTTEQNIQARARAVLLMALSNKTGGLVLTTGNKSETAVGYSTLYGDMAGGFAVLKDVYKTLVFELARYRNTLGEVIPVNVITRPPSAELAPDQVDEDSLPPYDVLDRIIEHYVERDASASAIVAAGIADDETVRRVLRMIDLNEYKRRQAAVGVRVTPRGFGRDRRYPITNGWRIGD